MATDKSPGEVAGQGYPVNRDMERSAPGARRISYINNVDAEGDI